MTYRAAYDEGVKRLQLAGVPDAEVDVRILLQELCGISRTDLLVRGEQEISDEKLEKFNQYIEKRCDRIPLQQLLGTTDFMGLRFRVNEHVLCPRQDTEVLVEEVMKNLHEGMRILDMCTGSGCILLSLLHYSNDCTGVGADLSDKALLVARENAEQLGLSERAVFVQTDLFEQVEGSFEIIVSNPPYIPSAVCDTLMPEVRVYEPRMALDGDVDGLTFYRRITADAMEYLCGGGMLFYEIGYDQGMAVKHIMEEAGFKEVQVLQDFAGLDRVVYGYK